jgi:hypothetical protein
MNYVLTQRAALSVASCDHSAFLIQIINSTFLGSELYHH